MEIIKIRAEINKIVNRWRKSLKPKIVIRQTNKINKPLVTLVKRKRMNTQITNTQSEKETSLRLLQILRG